MSEQNKGLQWYVLKVISGKEKKTKEYMELELERLGMKHLVPQLLVPVEKYIQMRQGKKISKERNFFPSYIMVQAELDKELEMTLKNMNNVIGFLGDNGVPVPMRQAEINRILGKVDELSQDEDYTRVDFYVGESVKVIDGPFNGFSGVVEELNEEKKKVKVVVKIFGRRTPLELSYMQIEKERS